MRSGRSAGYAWIFSVAEEITDERMVYVIDLKQTAFIRACRGSLRRLASMAVGRGSEKRSHLKWLKAMAAAIPFSTYEFRFDSK